jgi:hypothetical protein
LALILCRYNNVKLSTQFLIAPPGYRHWQDGMVFAMIGADIEGGCHGASA